MVHSSRIPIFQCLQCGTCCRNLLRETNTGLHGLNLFPSERDLFPQEVVAPYMGIGRTSPVAIILLQLTDNVCVHLSQDNRCKIHDNRPLACQAFPIVSVRDKPWITTECSSINATGEITMIMREERRASDYICRYIRRRIREEARLYGTTDLHLWEYDLNTSKWV